MNATREIVKREEASPDLHRRIQVVVPEVDIYESDDEILLHADMPGVLKEDISVNIDNGKLSLSGVRKLETSGAKNREEFGDVEFRRNFSVPQTIDTEKVNAVLKDGVLHLHLTKSEAAKPKQIEIRAA